MDNTTYNQSLLPNQPDEQDLLRDRFFSYIFHELRTPLTVIHSYAQILQTRLPAEPEFNSQRRIAEQMVSQGDELVEMLEELLEASRIPLGRLNLDLVEYDLGELIEELLGHLPAERRSQVEWQNPGQPVPVMAEGPRLERALGAILNFALQVHTPIQLELTLKTDDPRPHTWLTFATPGWQPSTQELTGLFDMYRPIREEQFAHSELKAGLLDISLFVARGLIEGHQGQLVFDAALPGFVVNLPLVA